MRFVWAVLAFVVAAVLIGAGIAQRTIFMGPSSLQTQVKVHDAAPFVLVDAAVLRANPGSQTLSVQGKGDVFVGYGRTADLVSWLADTDYNHVTATKSGHLTVKHVTEEVVADGAPAGRSPVGSDLLLDSFTGKGAVTADNLQVPKGMSVLISSDGTKDAPSDISVSWPLDNSTPLAGPLLAAGTGALLVGLILYVLGIRHQRRGRGPRRKGPGPLPKTEPILLAGTTVSEHDAIDTDPDDGKPPVRASRRHRMLALPTLAVIAVLATGCSADSWPQFGASAPSPSPSPSVIAPENQKPPAVTKEQAKRILSEISGTVAKADKALDVNLAKTRLEGAALAARTTEYALRKAIPDTKLPAVIPTDQVKVVLPEATDRWPRTVLLVSKNSGDDKTPPVILTMTQHDPWSAYKVSNMAPVWADAAFPEVAAVWLGTSLVPAESAFLALAPGDLANAFAKVVDEGEKSPSYALFDKQTLALAKSINDTRQGIVQKLADKGASQTSQIGFVLAPTDDTPVSMTTLSSGAIVAVSLTDTELVTPTTPDAAIRFDDNPEAKALTGVTEAPKGVQVVYQIQVYFSVPAQGSKEQIRLLGVQQDVLSAKVLQ